VIEDDPVVSLVLSEILVAHGISVISAKSGQDALAVFDQSGLEILVVVMDYAVPGMHAGQIVERLRDINSSVRVVLASGYSRGDISVELDLDEVDAFISKPFPPKALVEAVYELMNLAETRQPH
jgi:CheY-like chemotaxis protein